MPISLTSSKDSCQNRYKGLTRQTVLVNRTFMFIKIAMLRYFFVCLMLLSPQMAYADVGVTIGINFTYNGDIGITIKALSSDKRDERVFGVGSSYYPWADRKLGLDVGYGAADFNFVFLIGIDILQDASYLSVGYEDMSIQ